MLLATLAAASLAPCGQFTLDGGKPTGGYAANTVPGPPTDYSYSGGYYGGTSNTGNAKYCSGKITYAWTWSGPDAAPSQVVLKVEASANWTGPPGSCDDGLTPSDPKNSSYGGPTVIGQGQSGVRYLVKTVSGGKVVYDIEPTASTSGTCGVGVRVTLTPVTLTLSGGLCPTTREILVGQQLTASVNLGGIPTSPSDTYAWAFSDGSIGGQAATGRPSQPGTSATIRRTSRFRPMWATPRPTRQARP